MNLLEASQEFQIRLYRWAVLDFEREIAEAFPNLRLFKNGPIAAAHQFMLQSSERERVALAHSLLKRCHADAVRTLGATLSDEEKSRLSRFDSFRFGLAIKEGADLKMKYARKSKLRKAVGAAFKKAYGDRCLKAQTDSGWDPFFEMKVAGWILTTLVILGRGEGKIGYQHAIESETKVPNPDFPPEFWMPTTRLAQPISFASWLGIYQTEFTSILDGEIDQICEAIVNLCGHFFVAVPSLLKGLEYDAVKQIK